MITHLVLSGGGLKGFSYLGIIRYLYIEKMIEKIKYVSGSSIGAYFCLILALKIPIEFIEKEFSDLLEKINNEDLLTISKNNFTSLFSSLGFLSLDIIVQPIKNYLQEKYNIDDISFIDFIKKTGINLYITATNLNTSKRKIFSADDTPNVSVLKAVEASMSVPILFKPINIDDELYIDGVISCDLPLDIFKKVPKENKLAIILCHGTSEEPQVYEKGTKFDFLTFIIRTFYIMLRNLLSYFSNKYKSRNDLHILKIQDLPYDKTFKFHISNQNIKVEFTQNDLDNLTLKGFIDISEYMKSRYL